jgi:hypothetical protein
MSKDQSATSGEAQSEQFFDDLKAIVARLDEQITYLDVIGVDDHDIKSETSDHLALGKSAPHLGSREQNFRSGSAPLAVWLLLLSILVAVVARIQYNSPESKQDPNPEKRQMLLDSPRNTRSQLYPK